MATIKDIAKEAGVSLGTVSNMINKSAKVSKELSDRINKAIKKLKYVPNVHAKNLRLRTTKSFHIVLQDLDITTKDIVSKIISSCEDKKYTCTLFVTYYSSFKEEQFLKDIVKLGTDGVFLQSCSSTITKAQKDVLDKNIPIVYLDNYPSTNEHHSVAFNNYEHIHNGLKKYLVTHQIKPKDICLVHAGKQYNSDVDVESGIKDLIEEGYRNIKVDPRTESSFIKLINKIDEYTDKPKLYISTKDSIAKSIHKALHFFNLKADIMFFSNNEEIYKDNEIPIKRNAFELGKKAFECCTALESVRIPKSVKVIEYSAFLGCTSLKSICYEGDIDMWCGIEFEYLSNPLCNGGVLYIDEKAVVDVRISEKIEKIGKYTFEGCSSVKTVVLPESVLSIEEYAFSKCCSLEKIELSNKLESIGDYSFSDCVSLYSITVPESVKTIGGDAFNGCVSLSDVKLPENVNYVGEFAFYNCESLRSIILNEKLSRIGFSAFKMCNNLVILGKINSYALKYAATNNILFRAI